MAIEFNDNIHVKINRPTDFRFGPFISIAQANATIPIAQRYHGLIFGVYATPLSIATSDIIYYYYWNGLSNTDIKQLGGKPPVDGSYANQAAMIAAQATQTAQYIYYDGTSYWEYLGTTNGNISDYREINNSITNPITGTGASGQVSFWNGTTTQTGDSGLTWNNTTKTLDIGSGGTARKMFLTSSGSLGSNYIDFVNTTGRQGYIGYGNSSDDDFIIFQNKNSPIRFVTNALNRWSVLATGILQSTGAQTIQTSTGLLSLQANGGNVGINTTTDAGFRLDVNGTTRVQGDLTISDTRNIILATGTGTKIGTSTSQKLGFWNATPIVQPANTVAINDVLVNVGLRASGGISNFTSSISTTGNVEIGGQAYSPVNAKGNSGTGTVTFNWNDGNIQSVTLTGSCTFAFSNPQSGASYQIIIIQDGTGSWTITWPTIHWQGKVVPSLTGTANSKDILTITYDGTNYNAVMAKNFGTP